MILDHIYLPNSCIHPATWTCFILTSSTDSHISFFRWLHILFPNDKIFLLSNQNDKYKCKTTWTEGTESDAGLEPGNTGLHNVPAVGISCMVQQYQVHDCVGHDPKCPEQQQKLCFLYRNTTYAIVICNHATPPPSPLEIAGTLTFGPANPR